MSLHIGAQKDEIAEAVLLPGDPLRAKFIAENFLTDVKCYTQVRGMLGFTGAYKNKVISVQGTGMGLPSLSIYANELIDSYGVKQLIRVGSCGSFQPDIELRDVILAMSACSESNFNQRTFRGMDFAPTADFQLLQQAFQKGVGIRRKIHVGSVLSADCFYQQDPEEWKLWARHGVLAVEMETAALYTIAARKKRQALSILTVSDCLVTSASSDQIEREKTFTEMITLALETVRANS